MPINPTKDWIEIFDWTKSNGRADAKMVSDIVRNFNRDEFLPPMVLGHKSSYPKDTRVPVGANVIGVKADERGEKIFALAEYPEKLSVPIPAPYEHLVGMSEFFKEAVNKKLYTSRSIGVGTKPDGSYFLEHVGFLGAQLPEIKGMPAAEFLKLPHAAQSHFIEFSGNQSTEYDNIMKDFSKVQFPASVKPETQKKLLNRLTAPEFAQAPEDELMDLIRDLWDLDEDVTPEELVGIAKKLVAQAEEDEAATAGALEALMERPFFKQLAKTEDLKEFAAALKSIATSVKPIGARLDRIEQRQREFAENPAAAPATPAAPAVPATPATPVAAKAPAPESLNLSQDECDQAVQEATTQLQNQKNWIPAFDSTLTPIMPILANTKYDEGSALDQLVEALGAIEGLAEMSEHLTGLKKIIDFDGLTGRKNEIEFKDSVGGVRIPAGMPTSGEEEAKKITEYQSVHPGTSFEQALIALERTGAIKFPAK